MDGKQIGIVAAAGALIAGGAYYLGAQTNRSDGETPAVTAVRTAGGTVNDSSRPAEANGSRTQKVVLTAEWLTGSWVLAPKGGKDGKTRCDDFAHPSLYKMNDNTAKVLTFRPDRQYRDMFAHDAERPRALHDAKRYLGG